MAKKQIILYVVAALFAVSGIVALPSGNITGGVGCIVIAAVCFLLARKPEKEAAGQQEEPGKNGNACRCIWQQDCGNYTHEIGRRDF